MEIFNNTRNVNNKQTNITPRNKVKKRDNLTSSSNAVRIFIDPRTLSSTEYKLIEKENNSFPIYNPRVLMYDHQLNLQFYEKI